MYKQIRFANQDVSDAEETAIGSEAEDYLIRDTQCPRVCLKYVLNCELL